MSRMNVVCLRIGLCCYWFEFVIDLLCCDLQKSRKTKTPTKHTVEEVEKVKKEGEKIKEKQNLKKYVLAALVGDNGTDCMK